MDACEPKGYDFRPTRQFAQLYTIVRENPPPENETKHEWDPDQKIQHCILLSRLIHPTSISFEYAARVYLKNNDEVVRITRGPYQGLGTIAYIADTQRGWLTLNDAVELKALFEAFTKRKLCNEVSRAIWHFEYAARIYEIQVRWGLVVTGIESLIHTWGGKQFAIRLPQLAKELRIDEINFYEAIKMYNFRSNIVHGRGTPESNLNETKELYCKMERLLRNIIKAAIYEPELETIFSSLKAVKKRWPI